MNNAKNFALILGGSKGLGLGTVRKLCREGFPVIALHRDRRKDFDEIVQAFDDIRNSGGILHTFQMDALSRDARKAFIRDIPGVLGNARIGAVVYSIAKGNLQPLKVPAKEVGLGITDFRLTAEAMAFALYEWMEDLMQAGLLAGDCRIIAFTSEGSQRVLPHYGAVSCAKASLEALIRQMAVEWAPYGIRANCLQAGVTDTESLRMIPGSDNILAKSLERNPGRRLTLPEDVANAVYLLCLPEAAWINGNIIRIDGGEGLC